MWSATVYNARDGIRVTRKGINVADSRTTEERLRTWLEGQAQRERLCAHLLPLLGPYSNVDPRRPKGGPDGSRDLQAVHNGQLPVWGAVGFRSNVNDGKDDKKWAGKKFRDDLKAALAENPTLKGFVFLTNVDLTPAEQDGLKQHAKEKGITHVDVFVRERLRLALDNVEGWGYRLQYLEIEMTREEQLTFINRYGARLETLFERQRLELEQRQIGIDEKLRRLEFLHDYQKPSLWASFVVLFNKPVTPEEVGAFRVALHLWRQDVQPMPSFWIGAADGYIEGQIGGSNTCLWGQRQFTWTRNPDAATDGVVTFFNRVVAGIETGALLPIAAFCPTLADFDLLRYSIFVTRSIAPYIGFFRLNVNNYQVFGVMDKHFTAGDVSSHFPVEWPCQLTPEENDQWAQIHFELSGTVRHPVGTISFQHYTPHKAPQEEIRVG